MIIDLKKFLEAERPRWAELERLLERREADPHLRMSLDEVRRLHALYERVASDLARLATFSAEPETRRYLEALVARAYGEIHESREARTFRLGRWFAQTLPATFRRHARAFWIAAAITAAGSLFGALAVAFDPDGKEAILPFRHLLEDPEDRVAREERSAADRLQGVKTRFSAFLMTHNARVSIFVLALGTTWGAGTAVALFSNVAIIGAVSLDYARAGHAKFLLGWLLPHGAVEIPAVLIAGQAGFVLAAALIGRGSRVRLGARVRRAAPDLLTLIAGAGILLVWAGFVEAFLSQYHEPLVPYEAKIAFGALELLALSAFLAFSGRSR
ncbi:MAG: stage II sporulation protein M [Planctomycetota bacterium]